MFRFFALLLFCLTLSGRAFAVSPTCAQLPDMVCAVAADTVTGPLTLSGASPLVLDGTTAGTNATTVSVTDPTGARTFTIPDANSVAVQVFDCGAGNHADSISVTTGVVSCTPDTAGTNTLLDASVHTDTIAAASGVITRGDLIFGNATPAWDDLAVGTGFLKADGLDVTGWATIAAADIGAGDLANALVWNEACTAPTADVCTLANSPRTADTANAFLRTLKLRRVASAPGVNEYTLSGAALTLWSGHGVGTGADSLFVSYER
jgi:hypothetical protein